SFYNTALLGGILIFMMSRTLFPNPTFIYVFLVLIVIQIVLFYPSATSVFKISYLPLLFYGLIIISSILQLSGIITGKGKPALNLLNLLLFSSGVLIERYIFYVSYKSVGV
ncbi:MAG: hypothetical protein R3182_12555, partial [Draconibacterium sp.]|nr:hypothetical protein [Draconibacterium sp.]